MEQHPLVGRKFTWTWNTGFPGAAFEIEFISENKKRSTALRGLDYRATHTYDMAVVAPNIYMVSWLESNSITFSVVLNLDEMKMPIINTSAEETETITHFRILLDADSGSEIFSYSFKSFRISSMFWYLLSLSFSKHFMMI